MTDEEETSLPFEDRMNLPYTGLVTFLRSRSCDPSAIDAADIAILGAPSDEGSAWLPGSRLAPRSIRAASMRYAGRSLGGHGYFDPQQKRRYLEREFRLKRIVDCGDADVVYTDRERTWANITRAVEMILRQGAMPVVIGGDHGITYPVVRAFTQQIDVVHFDAHLDYRPFIHGVRYSNSTPMRLVADLGCIGLISQIGLRGPLSSESDLQDSLSRGNNVVTVREFRRQGPEVVVTGIAPGRKVYVSIDIDVLDTPLVPGCSTPEWGGLHYDELLEALSLVADRHEVVGIDVVEVNPLIDVPGGHTSRLAAQLILEFLGRVVDNQAWQASHHAKM
jgi:agmatinase